MSEVMANGPEYESDSIARQLALHYLDIYNLSETDLMVLVDKESDDPQSFNELLVFIKETMRMDNSLIERSIERVLDWMPVPVESQQVPNILSAKLAFKLRKMLFDNPNFQVTDAESSQVIGLDPLRLIAELTSFNQYIFESANPEDVTFDQVRETVPVVIQRDNEKYFALPKPNFNGLAAMLFSQMGGMDSTKNHVYVKDVEFSADLTLGLLTQLHQLLKFFLIRELIHEHRQLSAKIHTFFEKLARKKRDMLDESVKSAHEKLEGKFIELLEADVKQRGTVNIIFGFRDSRDSSTFEQNSSQRKEEGLATLEDISRPNSSESFINTYNVSYKNGAMHIEVTEHQSNWQGKVSVPYGCYIRYNTYEKRIEYGQEENNTIRWSSIAYDAGIDSTFFMLFSKLNLTDSYNPNFAKLNTLQQQMAIEHLSEEAEAQVTLFDLANFITNNKIGNWTGAFYLVPPTEIKFQVSHNFN